MLHSSDFNQASTTSITLRGSKRYYKFWKALQSMWSMNINSLNIYPPSPSLPSQILPSVKRYSECNTTKTLPHLFYWDSDITAPICGPNYLFKCISTTSYIFNIRQTEPELIAIFQLFASLGFSSKKKQNRKYEPEHQTGQSGSEHFKSLPPFSRTFSEAVTFFRFDFG